jgi:tRNA(Ile)-lysidine synthase
MTDMVDAVRAQGLLAEGRPVVVMYSGGRDSTCLLDLAARIAGPPAVSALHVNYGLRGTADADERHCAALCESLGIQLDVRRPVRPAEGAGNLQAWARHERYRAAGDLAVARRADVAVGHTRSDQVETILYRLASSPSRRAVLGMVARDGALVRPLLDFTREETGAYCTAQGLSWRDDETNDSAAYARNRIRREVVPALERVHPAAQENVLALAEILRAEAEVLDELVSATLDGRAEIAVDRLRELPPALRRLVVQRLADEAAGGFAPGAARRAQDIAALSERGTAMLDIGCGLRAVAEYGELRIERLDGGAARAPEPVRLPIPGSVSFAACEVSCEVVEPAREDGVLDRAALRSSALLVRSWRPGDRMAPLGLGGATKSLQDLFTARRVPRLERAALPVVEAQGHIAWVPGVATSERFKVTAATQEAVRLRCRTS